VQLSGFFSRRERSSDILTEETALAGNKNMFKDKRYRTSESLFADLTIEITLRSKSPVHGTCHHSELHKPHTTDLNTPISGNYCFM
jgi:hypothetical protein